MKPPRLMIVICSTRPGRVGPALGRWIEAEARKNGQFELDIADLKDINLPMMDELNHPRLKQYTQPHTLAWSARVDQADAFVLVSPEYNFAMNAPLKNALDYLYQEWAHKPVGLLTYGGVSGGLRAAQMIKQVVTALNMMPISEAVTVPFVRNVIGEQGEVEPTAAMAQSAQTMLGELARWEAALRSLRTSS